MRRLYVTLVLLLFIFIPLKFSYANNLEITPTLFFFNYQEFDPNDVLLDKEQGALPGVRLSYGDVAETASVKFNAALYGGSVDYDGQTQSGTPHTTDTDEQLIKLGISYLQHEAGRYPGLFFAGLHYWYWDRNILTRNGVQGLHERYTWYEAELGLKFKSTEIHQSSYWLELSAMYIFKPRMKLFLPSSELEFSLKSRPGYRIRAGKTWTNNETMTTTISLFAEYWEFGRSNTIFTTDFFGTSGFLTEPDSETLHSGFEISFIFDFQ